MSRERIAMLAVLALAALGCLLDLVAEPATGLHGGVREQLLDLLHVLGTVALTLSLLLGPGIAWRAIEGRERAPGLGFLFLPGLVLMAATGVLAWALAGEVDPRSVCLAVAVPVLGGLAAAIVWAEPGELFDADERRCLLVVGCVLGLAVGRALWSLGPDGELYAGHVSRTLEVGERSDSRIPFILPQLVANGAAPYGALATEQFSPYNFSSRGPLPGLASAPVALLGGGRPPATFPEQPWSPFDREGFMAYRLAMICFACTAFLSLWDLVRRLAGRAGGYLALLLAATTPFLVHEVWFTWPKMLAASVVLLAAICVLSDRPLQGGLLAGFGYLMHPVALLSVPVLVLLALWPPRGARWNRPRLAQLLALGAGLGAFLLAWRLGNGSHFDQGGFVNYLVQAGGEANPPLASWLDFRIDSLGNTLVPFVLLHATGSGTINAVGETSPAVVHFFFQYWNTLPFGLAIVFFPLLLVALWRAARRWPWAVFATVLVPLLVFTAYWGAISTGMMREGLHAWALTLVAVVACEQAASGFGWLRSVPIRVLLTLRVLEVMAVVALPTLATRGELISATVKLTDAVAVLAIACFGAALALLVWRARPPGEAAERDRSAASSRAASAAAGEPAFAPGSRRG